MKKTHEYLEKAFQAEGTAIAKTVKCESSWQDQEKGSYLSCSRVSKGEDV